MADAAGQRIAAIDVHLEPLDEVGLPAQVAQYPARHWQRQIPRQEAQAVVHQRRETAAPGLGAQGRPIQPFLALADDQRGIGCPTQAGEPGPIDRVHADMQQLVGRCQDQHRCLCKPSRCGALPEPQVVAGPPIEVQRPPVQVELGAVRGNKRPAGSTGQFRHRRRGARQGLFRPPAERQHHVDHLRQPIGRHHDVHVVHRPQIDRAAERGNEPGALQHDDRDPGPGEVRQHRAHPMQQCQVARPVHAANPLHARQPGVIDPTPRQVALDQRQQSAPAIVDVGDIETVAPGCERRRDTWSVQQRGTQQMHVLPGQAGPCRRRIEHARTPAPWRKLHSMLIVARVQSAHSSGVDRCNPRRAPAIWFTA